MKYVILAIIITLNIFAAEQYSKIDQIECQKLIQNGNIEEIQRRGCCSWHKGVCGCNSSGRVECCDGTLSPTCTCKGGDHNPNDKIN